MDLHSLLDERLRNQLSYQEQQQQARKRQATASGSPRAVNHKSPSHTAASLLFASGKLNKSNLFRLFRSNGSSNSTSVTLSPETNTAGSIQSSNSSASHPQNSTSPSLPVTAAETKEPINKPTLIVN